MKFKWEHSDFEEFSKQLSEKYAFKTSLITATQNISRVLHSALLSTTPIDTGNLRKMWSAGDNLYFTVENLGNKYRVTLINQAKREPTAAYPDGYKYGVAVNDGHRTPSGGWVMGRFFVDKSIVIAENKAEKIIREELSKWWEAL